MPTINMPNPAPVSAAEPQAYIVTVLESRPETGTTHRLRTSRPAGFVFNASSAVRMTLHGADNGEERRPLSMSSSPTRDYLEWVVRVSDSAFKQAFAALKPGDPVSIIGPRGRFWLDADRPAVMVAGGVGITPMQSMIEYATDAQLATPITLLYSSRDVAEIVFRQELDAYARQNPNLHLVYTLTRPTDQQWPGRVGRIDEDLLREACQRYTGALYYVSGTPSLVDDTISMLQALGVSDEDILHERFRGYARQPA